MGPVGLPEIFVLLFTLVFLLPFWKIFSKAGYSGWLCLLMAIPGVNAVTIFWFGFADWPVLKKQP
jgi:hypothetical protein